MPKLRMFWSRSKADGGFTILETLIAVVILVTVGAVVIGTVTTSTKQTSKVTLKQSDFIALAAAVDAVNHATFEACGDNPYATLQTKLPQRVRIDVKIWGRKPNGDWINCKGWPSDVTAPKVQKFELSLASPNGENQADRTRTVSKLASANGLEYGTYTYAALMPVELRTVLGATAFWLGSPESGGVATGGVQLSLSKADSSVLWGTDTTGVAIKSGATGQTPGGLMTLTSTSSWAVGTQFITVLLSPSGSPSIAEVIPVLVTNPIAVDAATVTGSCQTISSKRSCSYSVGSAVGTGIGYTKLAPPSLTFSGLASGVTNSSAAISWDGSRWVASFTVTFDPASNTGSKICSNKLSGDVVSPLSVNWNGSLKTGPTAQLSGTC